jgi:membrane protease YdiL (CAAX protease family)
LPPEGLYADYPLGEEFGWRGYLLRRLKKGGSWRRATLVIGAVWALYHIPLVIFSPTGVWPAATAITYAISSIALAVPFTWFAAKAKRGSVIPASVLHASLNAWNQTLVGEPAFGAIGLLQGDQGDTWILAVEGLAGVVICVIVAATFWPALARMDREEFEFEAPRA